MKSELNRWFAITNYRLGVFWSTLFFDGWTCVNVCTLSSCFELSVLKRVLWNKWDGFEKGGMGLQSSGPLKQFSFTCSLFFFHPFCSLVHDNFLVFTSLPVSLCTDNVPMSKEPRQHLLKCLIYNCNPCSLRREWDAASDCWHYGKTSAWLRLKSLQSHWWNVVPWQMMAIKDTWSASYRLK